MKVKEENRLENKKTQKKPRGKLLRIVGKILKWTGICILSVVLLFTAVCAVARLINGVGTKIRTENGIQEKIYVDINGIQQYLHIRGEDQANPIILFVHGGPGGPMAYTGYMWQTGLEDSYTVVHWDQRGSGRTYYENPGSQPPTTQLLLSDMNAIVDYLCDRFGQQKVVVMGHSWGTVLGTKYIQAHPEKVSAYIGVGQVIDMKKVDAAAAEYAIKYAEQAGNFEDAEQIKACLEIYINGNDFTDSAYLENYTLLLSLTSDYRPSEGVVEGLPMMWLGLASPDMSWRDIKWFLGTETNKSLVEELFEFDIYNAPSSYDVPVYFITGENDWGTPASLIQDYFETIIAPQKNIVVVKEAGHNVFVDNPEEFCETVKALLD